MIYNVEISSDAKEDLRDIYKYIAYELLVIETAIKQIKRIEKKILSLDVMPERYRIYDSSKWECLRMMPVDNYNVFYIINDATKKVHVARVLYGKRNFESILK